MGRSAFRRTVIQALRRLEGPVTLDEFADAVARARHLKIRSGRGSLEEVRSAVLAVLQETGWDWLVFGDAVVPGWVMLEGVRVRLELTQRDAATGLVSLDRLRPFLMAFAPDDMGAPPMVSFRTPDGEPVRILSVTEAALAQAAATREAWLDSMPASSRWPAGFRSKGVTPWERGEPQAGALSVRSLLNPGQRPYPGDSILVTLHPSTDSVVLELERAARRRPEGFTYGAQWLDALAQWIGRTGLDRFGRAVLHTLPVMAWARSYPAGDLEQLAYCDQRVVVLEGLRGDRYVAQPALCRLGESVDHRVLVDVKGFEDLDDSLATNDDQPGLPAEVLRRSKKGQGTRRRAGYGQTSGRRWAPPASRQVVRFKVELRHYGVYRVIDVPGDGTLHDLHGAIQQAFGWDDDHLYAFFMDRKGWRSKDRYESPYSDRSPSASAAVIEELKLRTGKKIEYLFDFGDEWWHDVEVVGRFPRVAGVRYPRVVEAVGDPPPQYGDLAVE